MAKSGGAGTPDPVSSLLAAEQLRRRCDPKAFSFKTTADLEPVEGLVGQDRALDALSFGVDLDAKGYNIFVLGEPASGKHNAVRAFLTERASGEPTPDDWVYLHNFQVPYKPRALRMPPGRGPQLRDAMAALIDGLRTAMPAVFESEDYQERRKAIEEEFRRRREEGFKHLGEKAEAAGLGILRTETGFAIVPMHQGKPIKPEVFEKLPDEERQATEKKIEELRLELGETLENVPRLDKQRRERLQALHRDLAGVAVRQAMNDLVAAFKDVEGVSTYLDAVRKDLVDNAHLFVEQATLPFAEGSPASASAYVGEDNDPRFRRYEVNVCVCHPAGDTEPGAPVIYDDRPGLGHLLGRIEHIAHMGALVTDFTLIKPGSLHEANGGYLLIDAARLLMQPGAWEGLKRCLRSEAIAIESPFSIAATATTITLEPDPIPLDLKVVLFGDRMLYYMLAEADPDFGALFKVAADFDEVMERDGESTELFARLIAGISRREELLPLQAAAVATVVEHASRLADDAERLSIRVGHIADLLREANYWAAKASRKAIAAKDVQRAIDEQVRRLDRVRERLHEQITRDSILIDTEGSRVGQINGLAVLRVGNFSFGKPSRITARVRMGAGKVIDIEREVELGGPLHAKGVLILSGFLAARYALGAPMSLAATLVFEQSYGGIDGDSASSAELYALLSALSGQPIDQGLAVTGSVNQNGDVQVIGGVNEKIEGFFDICAARGLTGRQGVLVPQGNVKNLMLRADVVEACDKGRFQIHAVSHVDQGIEILTGVPAGERDGEGRFGDETINAMVERRLLDYAETRRRFAKHTDDDNSHQS